MQAVIFAGGAGTRLYPLTLKTPKAMIEVNGKPFVWHIIKELKRQGIKDIVFCIGYLAEQFKVFFGDGSRFGIKITYSVEKGFMGTGGALKLAARYLKKDFFVVNGDTYLPIDYRSVYASFKKARKCGLMVIYDNKKKIAKSNTAVDEHGVVTGYATGPCRFLDAGVQVFDKKILGLVPRGRVVSLEKEIFPQLIKDRALVSYIVSQRYYDIGTPQRLKLIRRYLK